MKAMTSYRLDAGRGRVLEDALSAMLSRKPYIGHPAPSPEAADSIENLLAKVRRRPDGEGVVHLDSGECDTALWALSELQQERGGIEDYLLDAEDDCGGLSFYPAFTDAETLWLYLAASPANGVSVTLKDGARVELRPNGGCPSVKAVAELGEGVYKLPEGSIRHFAKELRERAAQQPGAGSEWDEICNFVRNEARWLPATVGAITSDGDLLEVKIGGRRFLNPSESEMERIRLPRIPAGDMLGGRCYVLAYPSLDGQVRPMLGNPLQALGFSREEAVPSEMARNILYGMETVFSTRYTILDMSEYLGRAMEEELDGFGLIEDRALLERTAANFEPENPYDAIDREARQALECAKDELARERAETLERLGGKL